MANPLSIYQVLLKRGLPVGVALSAFLIIPFEGEVRDKTQPAYHVAYKDPVGIPTACWGQTDKTIKLGMKFTDEQCINFLYNHLKKNEVELDRLLKVETQNDYQTAALIDFLYNAGAGNLSKSTMLKLFNEQRYEEACEQLSRWVWSQGKKLNGLVRRREEEKAYCLGKPPDNVKEAYEDEQVE